MHFLVGRSHEVLGKELVTSLYKEEVYKNKNTNKRRKRKEKRRKTNETKERS